MLQKGVGSECIHNASWPDYLIQERLALNLRFLQIAVSDVTNPEGETC